MQGKQSLAGIGGSPRLPQKPLCRGGKKILVLRGKRRKSRNVAARALIHPGKRGQDLGADSVAGKLQGSICFIRDIRKPALLRIGAQLRFGKGKQRAKQQQLPQIFFAALRKNLGKRAASAQRRHAARPAAARQAVKHRLGDIIHMMRGCNASIRFVFRAKCAQRFIAPLPRGLLNAHAAFCGKSRRFDMICKKRDAPCTAHCAAECFIPLRVFPQAVIDMHRSKRQLLLCTILPQQMQQHNGIRTAGKCADNSAARLSLPGKMRGKRRIQLLRRHS